MQSFFARSEMLQFAPAIAIQWLSLLASGRIFSFVNSETDANLKDDAIATTIVIAATGVAILLFSAIGLPVILCIVVYYYLIYNTFQLDGLRDIAIFFFLNYGMTILIGQLGFPLLVSL